MSKKKSDEERKATRKAVQKRYREKHHEQLRVSNKKYAAENPDKIKAKGKRYNRDNKEKRSAHSAKYYQDNIEEMRERTRKRDREHPEAVAASKKKYNDANQDSIKASAIIRTTANLTAWEKYVASSHPDGFACEVCGKSLVFSTIGKGRDHDYISWDHKTGQEPVKNPSPSNWLRGHQTTDKNVALWEECSFGMLCAVCNFQLGNPVGRIARVYGLYRYVNADTSTALAQCEPNDYYAQYVQLHGTGEGSRRVNINSWDLYLHDIHAGVFKCAVCARDLVLHATVAQKRNTVHWDHRQPDSCIPYEPARWFAGKKATPDNIKIWEKENFGMLCVVCNVLAGAPQGRIQRAANFLAYATK